MTKKPVPQMTLNKLYVPDEAYKYFAAAEHPFRADAGGYDPVNAWWLSEAAFLAYTDENFTGSEKSGLKAAGYEATFFAEKGTHCFVLHGDEAVIVIFRGTQIDSFWASVTDLVTDGRFFPAADEAGGRVHKGFRDALDLVWPRLLAHLRQLLQGDGAGRTLWLTGHSLGGALATLAADRLTREPGFEVRGLYTFGSPRVGDESFRSRFAAHGFARNAFRVVNNTDAIAQVPPEQLYRHVGLVKFIGADGVLRHLDGDEAGLPSRPKRSAAALSFFAKTLFAAPLLRRLPVPVPQPLADHAPVYYCAHLWNSFNS